MKTAVDAYFSEIRDPRVTGRCLHLLSDILLIGLCTYLTGGSDYQDMHLFGIERGAQLGGLLRLPNGVPSEDTFERVFKRIRPEELENCLRNYGHSILSDLSEKQIVIDGKKQRGASPTTRGNRGLYLLNAWVSENRFCIARSKVEDKSNEITAIPQVLSNIDIEEAVVSIDAMGTQREIANLIVEKKGHYLLALKTNQRSLYEDVGSAFKTHGAHDVHETLDADHGRIETRKCSILPAREFLLDENLEAWSGLNTIVRVESTREIRGRETRYCISDESEGVRLITRLLSEGIGVLIISCIGIWTSPSGKTRAERGQAIRLRICRSCARWRCTSYPGKRESSASKSVSTKPLWTLLTSKICSTFDAVALD